LRPQGRDRQQFAAQRLARIIQADERVDLQPAAPTAGKSTETTAPVTTTAARTTPRPNQLIARTVVVVTRWGAATRIRIRPRLRLVAGPFGQRLAELDQVGPRLGVFLGLEAVDRLVWGGIFANIIEPAAPARAATDLPARPIRVVGEPLLEKLLVELLG